MNFKKRHENPKLHPLIQIVIFLFFLFSGILVTGYSHGAGISQLVAMDLLRVIYLRVLTGKPLDERAQSLLKEFLLMFSCY